MDGLWGRGLTGVAALLSIITLSHEALVTGVVMTKR